MSDAVRAHYPTYGSGEADKTRQRRIRQLRMVLMRRERLIRPTVQACRHDKTRQRRIRHLRMVSDAARAPYPTYGSGL
ncbi:hypothetical protein ACLB1R_18035 [Escherichia coli]